MMSRRPYAKPHMQKRATEDMATGKIVSLFRVIVMALPCWTSSFLMASTTLEIFFRKQIQVGDWDSMVLAMIDKLREVGFLKVRRTQNNLNLLEQNQV